MPTFLPIVRRELIVAARRPITFRIRLLAAAVTLVIIFAFLSGNTQRFGRAAGGVAFSFLTTLAMAYCLLEGIRSTSDCLSKEKRHGTLGLLFLTDLTGHDIVLGKLAATSLNSLYGLLAIYPVLGITLLAGGVTGGEFWRVTLVLANSLAFSLALGLWISARSLDAYPAAVSMLIGLVVVAGVPVLVDWLLFGHPTLFSLISPAYNCYAAYSAVYSGLAGHYWGSLGLVHLLMWFFLLLAGRTVARHWQTEAPDWWGGFWQRRKSHEAYTLRRPPTLTNKKWLQTDPARWLTQHFQSASRLLWLPVMLAVGALLWQAGTGSNMSQVAYSVIALMTLATMILIHLTMAAQSGRCFLETRTSGILELVCCTPLKPAELIRGQRNAQRALFYRLAFIGALLYACTTYSQFLMLSRTPGMAASTSDFFPQIAMRQALALIVYLMDLYALGWLAMWLALKVRTLNQVITRSFLYVIVLPWLGSMLLQFFGLFAIVHSSGFIPISMVVLPLLMIIKDILFICYARTKLYTQFRSHVAQGNEIVSV